MLVSLNPLCIPSNVEMLSERLKKLDYRTSLLGKWHLGFCQEDCLPTNRGFDNFYGFFTGGSTYYEHLSGKVTYYHTARIKNGTVEYMALYN